MSPNLFDEIKFNDNDNDCQLILATDSKWTTEQKILKNSETGEPYYRYITTIEAEPTKGYGYKIGHALTFKSVKNICHSRAEWIRLETKKVLTIDEPILKMSYMKQNDGRFPWVSFEFIEFKVSKQADTNFGWEL